MYKSFNATFWRLKKKVELLIIFLFFSLPKLFCAIKLLKPKKNKTPRIKLEKMTCLLFTQSRVRGPAGNN
jgi:hypothetical protein